MRLALRRQEWTRLCFLAVAVCLLATHIGISLAVAQNSPRAAQQAHEQLPPSTYRTLTLKEERAIVNAAWEHRLSGEGVEDCSHIVNQIYGNAGYDYPYASSFDLYRGTPNFVRVKAPQPGDLIAWPGHVGIVLNPKHHSFYSLVSTGLEAQNYRGAYWSGRGTPRFYRYIVERPAQGATRTARGRNAELKTAPRNTPNSDETPELSSASVIEKQIDKEARSASVAAQPRPEPRHANAAQRDSVASAQHAARPESETKSPPASSSGREISLAAPTTIAIETASARPTRDEVAEGVLALTNTSAESLAGGDALTPAKLVIVVEQLRVDRVEIKGDHGWAHLEIDSRVCLSGDGVNFKARHDKARWELRRSESGWTATVPPDRSYVSRDAAVRVLSARLAQLSASDAAAQRDEIVLGQEARLANLLSGLLGSR
jgi:NlpC/P60 family